jgi:hypothetical protein
MSSSKKKNQDSSKNEYVVLSIFSYASSSSNQHNQGVDEDTSGHIKFLCEATRSDLWL